MSRSRLWRAATPSLKSISSVTSSQLNKDLKACFHREHYGAFTGATHTQRSEVERCVCVAAVNARNAQKICSHTHTTIDNARGRCLAVCVCVRARAHVHVCMYVRHPALFSQEFLQSRIQAQEETWHQHCRPYNSHKNKKLTKRS